MAQLTIKCILIIPYARKNVKSKFTRIAKNLRTPQKDTEYPLVGFMAAEEA